MAQPPAYNRQKDFSADYGDQTDNQAINNELDGVARSVNGIRENLAKIQRDDGGLVSGIVTEDSLDPALKDALYDQFSANVSDAVLQAQQAAVEANTAAIAAEDARDATQAIAQSFGDLDSARTEWEAAVVAASDSATSAADSAGTASQQAGIATNSAAQASAAADLAQASSNTVWRKTKALLDAVTTVPDGTPGVVTDDPVVTNNGYYLRDGGVWGYMAFQPAAMSLIDNKLFPYRGVLPAGSLAQRHVQGVYLCSAGTAYTDVPEGLDTTQSFMLYSINWSTDALNRYQEQTIKMFTDPSVTWSRRFDNSNPTANPWRRDALNGYRGVTPKTNANDITEPGLWLYTAALTSMPPGAPSSGMFEVEQFGTYRYQHIRSLTDVGYRHSRIIRVSPVEQGAWQYTGGLYRGSVSTGHVNTYREGGNYLFTEKLPGMPEDGPSSGFFDVDAYGDWVYQEVSELIEPANSWRRTYRISNDRDYGWVKVGPGGANPILDGVTAFFGDSMTQSGNYPELIAARCGLTALKFGFGGCNLAKHNRSDAADPYYDKVCMYNLARYIATGDYTEAVAAAEWLATNTTSDFRATVATMAATDWNTVKRLCMFFGTNDYGAGTAIGLPTDNLSDGSTFYGAINYIVTTLTAAYPHLDLLFITPPYRYRAAGAGTSPPPLPDSDVNPNRTSGIFLREYVEAIQARCDAYRVPYCDLYHESGINSSNHLFMLPDGLHPGDGAFGGKQRVADRIGGFLISRA